MALQAIAAVAWLIWLCSGTAGLKECFTLGAILVVAFAVKRFLDFHWKPQVAEKPRREEHDSLPFYSAARYRRGVLPSPNWDLSRLGMDQSTPASGRFGRRSD